MKIVIADKGSPSTHKIFAENSGDSNRWFPPRKTRFSES